VIRRILLLLLIGATVTACTGPSAPPPKAPRAAPGGPQTGALPGSVDSPSAGLGSARPSPSASPSAPGGTAAGWWHPRAGMSWQWQLTGTIDTSVAVDVYDVDAFTTPAATVAALHAAGRKVICYVNAGAKEDFRADAAKFPASVVGRPLEGWPGEKWLDIRRWSVLEPVLTERFSTCKSKGFDAVEPDNVDGYANESGFDLTAQDQLTYNRHVADLAHRLNLAVGLKNDVEQAGALAAGFDFAVNEQCAQYSECDELKVFVAAGKPVFHVEYTLDPGKFCPQSKMLGFSSMRKKEDLGAWRQPC
jgi:endo-alpha-1,4-polygalactosaminidase (GH114 family)